MQAISERARRDEKIFRFMSDTSFDKIIILDEQLIKPSYQTTNIMST